jgi:hypothetical protein
VTRLRARLVVLVVAAALAGPAPARATERRRRVAVVEHRAGVTRAADLAARMAVLLRQTAAVDVLDPHEARRRLNGRLDALIARCGGDAHCVGEIGDRLKVDEVILVGISQLGDIILALQRIGVANRAVVSRIAEALPPETEPSDEALLGYLKRLLPAEVFRRYGAIQVKANVTGAEVDLDGTVRGTTPLGAIKVVAPRRYQLTVRKAGYLDFFAALDVQPDGLVEVRPDLQRRAGELAWYQRWWVWGIAGAVLAGSATALVLSLRPAAAPQNVPIYLDPNRPR